MNNHWPDRRLRHSVQMQATVLRANGKTVETTVDDLSLDGCRLTGNFKIAEAITVNLPKIGPMQATVRWAFLGRAGARFTPKNERTQDVQASAVEKEAS